METVLSVVEEDINGGVRPAEVEASTSYPVAVFVDVQLMVMLET